MGVVQAKNTAATNYGGVDYVVTAGQIFDDRHPLVKGRPDLFGDVEADVPYEAPAEAPRVEQATKAPGEKRNR